MSCLLGIDLGASSIKASLLDCAGGDIVTARHPVTTRYPQPGWVEQCPYDWLDSLQLVLAQLPKGYRPDAIALSAGTHIPVLLDAYYRPLRPAILWSDQRSAAQAQWLIEQYGDYIENTCLNTPSATWTLAMLLWLQRHEPMIVQRSRYLVFAKDYLKFVLCGALTTDPGDATGAMLYDRHQQCWDEKLATLCQLDLCQLPLIDKPTAIIGETNAQAAQRFGITRGIPIVNGSIDTSTELLCTGAVHEGDRMVKLASAGVFSWISDRVECRTPVSCYPHPLADSCYYATGTNTCLTSVDWFGTHVAKMDDCNLSAFDQLVATSNSSTLPLFHPYLRGERAPLWNSQVKAAFNMVSIDHQLADLAKAVYLGICFSIRHLIARAGYTASPESKLCVLGGGTHSDQLCQMLASVLQQPFFTCEHNDASTGSAILAGLAMNTINLDDLNTGQTRNWYPQRDQYQEQWQEYLALADYFDSVQGRYTTNTHISECS